jgi:NAD(P)-dependent dehydrogenase (short-subunit alcohol dehydrogenase family)
VAGKIGDRKTGEALVHTALEQFGRVDVLVNNAGTFKYQDSPREWHFVSPNGNVIRVPVSGSVQMNNSLGLREALLNEAGITLTPTFVVGDEIKAGRLQADPYWAALIPEKLPSDMRIVLAKFRQLIDDLSHMLRE